MRHAGAWAVGVALLASGCRAQVHANAEVRDDDDRRWEPGEAEPQAQLVPPGAPNAGASVGIEPVHVGRVVHDLTLAPNAPRDAVCLCLAVAYGPVSDPRFAWQSPPPVEGDAMAIAVASDGATCANAAPPTSIAGVGREGDDVVLTVERARDGVPLMRGAVVQRPPAAAHLIVRTRRRETACRLDLK